MNADWPDMPGSLDEDIEKACEAGWSVVAQVGHGTCDNALIRSRNGITDLVTIPLIGYSTVVRLQGGPAPGRRRHTGHQWWRHLVPTGLAVEWVLTNPQDDRLLVEWDLDRAGR
jgi:hypothetical protein